METSENEKEAPVVDPTTVKDTTVEMVKMIKSPEQVGTGATEIFILPGRVAEHIEAGWKRA